MIQDPQLIKEFVARAWKPSTEAFIPGTSRVPVSGPVYGNEELENAVSAVLEFQPSAGRWAERLERGLARRLGTRYAMLCNSGSSANLLAVAALVSEGLLRAGDEVVTVAACFPTTVAPLVQHGLVPVFVDVDLATANVDVSQLEKARSSRTRAVMLAHTLGNPFNVDAALDFCAGHELVLIEDNSDALGALYQDQETGTFGALSTLSFYPAHHLTTGEGGAVFTSDPHLARTVTSLRDWGRSCWCPPGRDNTCGKRFGRQAGKLPTGFDHKYTYSELGYNLKLTDMQAAIGVAQLNRLDAFIQARRENWKFYREALDDLWRVFILPQETSHSMPSPFGFLLTVQDGTSPSRNEIVQALEAQMIQTRMLFAGNITRQPAMESVSYRVVGELKNTDKLMNDAFWIGVHPAITPEMRDYVVKSIREIARG